MHAQGTVKASAGSVNVTVCCGGQIVSPGDVVIADDDGVCVIDRVAAPGVLQACGARTAREAAVRELLRDGVLSLDHNNLRAVIERLGVRYMQRADEAGPGWPAP